LSVHRDFDLLVHTIAWRQRADNRGVVHIAILNGTLITSYKDFTIRGEVLTRDGDLLATLGG